MVLNASYGELNGQVCAPRASALQAVTRAFELQFAHQCLRTQPPPMGRCHEKVAVMLQALDPDQVQDVFAFVT